MPRLTCAAPRTSCSEAKAERPDGLETLRHLQGR